jgi:hypothetical protein
MVKYKQAIIPEITSIWHDKSKDELRHLVLEYIKAHFKGLVVKNAHLNLPITITVTSGRKTALGSAMYSKKAELIRLLPAIIRVAQYNNFGTRKETDNPAVIGYLNFKAACKLDGKVEHVRLAVQFQKGGKYYYNIEVNKKEDTPKKPRR